MSASQQAIPGHGPTQIEEAILDRADGGVSITDIAAELELPAGRVHNIIRCFREGKPDDWQADARRGSRALLKAIQRLQMSAAA